MSTSIKTNLILDLTIFGAFLVVYSPRLTGSSLHEWLGLSFAAGIITHLLFHWKWLVKIGAEFFRKLIHQSRLNFIFDALFFVAITGSIFSGILISKDILQLIGIQLNPGQSWKMIHSLTSDASLIILGIHSALHWKWIVISSDRYILAPIRSLLQKQPAPQTLAIRQIHIDETK